MEQPFCQQCKVLEITVGSRGLWCTPVNSLVGVSRLSPARGCLSANVPASLLAQRDVALICIVSVSLPNALIFSP